MNSSAQSSCCGGRRMYNEHYLCTTLAVPRSSELRTENWRTGELRTGDLEIWRSGELENWRTGELLLLLHRKEEKIAQPQLSLSLALGNFTFLHSYDYYHSYGLQLTAVCANVPMANLLVISIG